MTDSDWPAGPAIVVSDDEPRAAVLAAHVPDAYITRPEAQRREPPGGPAAAHLVVLAGTDVGRAVSELGPRLGDDATLLVEVADGDPAVDGWRTRGEREVAGFRFVELTRTAASRAPIDAAQPVPAATAPGAAPDALPDALPHALPAAAGSAGAQGDTTAPAGSRRTRLLLLAVLAGLLSLALALVIALVIALVTTTGYVGFAATFVACVVVGIAALGALQLRSAASVQRALSRSRARAKADRARTDKHVRDLRTRTAALDDRLATLERELHVVSATTLETARRLPEPRTPETFTDPHELSSQHQHQALANLFALVPVRGVVPFMGGWAASPDLVLTLVGELLTRRPALVVECGSGVSTLWMALVTDHLGLETRIVSLDHDPFYAEQTRQTLRAHGVDRVAEVRDAPLAPTGLPGHDTPWYAREAVEDLHDIGLLFVDGPPEATGPLVRLPAVPLLKDRLAPRASVLLDDVVRAGEQEVTARWASVLPDFTLTHLPLQKGASLLRRG